MTVSAFFPPGWLPMDLFNLFRRNGAARARVAAVRARHAAGTPTGRWARAPAAVGPVELSFAARQWLKAIPTALQPLELCRAYPRVANRIALCWDDTGLAGTVFNELLVDSRGGREGFPSAVAAELLRLHAWCERRAAAARFASG